MPLLLLTAAIVAGALTDVALTYVSLHTASPELSWLKIGWEAEALLLILAAVAAVEFSEAAVRPHANDVRDRGLAAVLAGVAVTLAVVVVDSLFGEFPSVSRSSRSTWSAAIALRLLLTSSEREQIASARGLAARAEAHRQHRRAHRPPQPALRRPASARTRAARAARTRRLETGVVILDLDQFKEVNDAPAIRWVMRFCARRPSASTRASGPATWSPATAARSSP